MSLLKSIHALRAKGGATRPPAPSGPAGAPAVRGHFERLDGLSLHGWACGGGDDEHFDLLCNGQPTPCVAVRLERADVRDAIGSDRLALGFEVELPGLLWAHADAAGQVAVELRVDGQALTRTAVPLQRACLGEIAQALRAAEPRLGAAPLAERAQWQYQLFQLIEHVGVAGLAVLGDAGLRAWLEGQAARFKVSSVLGQAAPVEAPLALPQDLETVHFWRALREFNLALGEDASDPGRILDQILDGPVRSDALAHRIVFALVPFFCGIGAYDRIRPRIDVQRLRRLAVSTQAHDLSLLLPEWVASGEFTRAVHLTRQLAQPAPGWLNTECVRAAVAAFARALRGGAVPVPRAVEWVEALGELFESEGERYWSRLHDRHMMAAAIDLLSVHERLPEETAETLVETLAAAYVLAPDFWTALAGSALPRAAWPAALAQAEAEARRVFAWLERPEAVGLPDLLVHLPLLARLARAGSLDAAIALRESVLAVVPDLAGQPPAALQALHDALLDLAPEEPLRLAAHPLADAALVRAAPALRERVRSVSGVAPLPHHEAHERVVDGCERIALAARAGDADAVRRALHALAADCELLCAAACACSGAQLLARAVAAGQALLDDVQLGGWLSRVHRLWKLALDATAADPKPAAAVVGVRDTLRRLAHTRPHADLLHLLAEIEVELVRRLGPSLADYDPIGPLLKSVQGDGPLAATLVVIYSCRKNLETRIRRIRETWIPDLVRLGIPYVVLVGGGDDTLQGDVLELDVSDAYEDLPAKTLRMIRWVQAHTDFEHLFKIDDDCHLAADLFARASVHGAYHYQGRRLRRLVGDTDRRWHHGRSASTLAGVSIDKSPEPSEYADGGAAYALSRLAMSQLLRTLDSHAGARLTRGAFMEDKLLGDLLALAGHGLSDAGHETLLRRRFGAGAVPVNAWHSSFYPGPHSPTLVSHLDDAEALPQVQAGLQADRLAPPRLWPTHHAPDLKFAHNVNQLELLSPASALGRLHDAPLIVVAVARNEGVLLPHFLAHYRGLGVAHFILVDNLSDDGSREYLLQQPDVVLYSADTNYRGSHYGVSWQQAVLGAHALGKWVVLADIDEFLVYDDCENRSLPEWIRSHDAAGHQAVLTLMIDMVPPGHIDQADLTRVAPFDACTRFDRDPLRAWRIGSGTFSNCTTWVSALRHRMIADSPPNSYTSQKIAAFRYQPWVRLTEGLHYASNLRLAPRPAWFAHFKYHAGFRRKVLSEVARRQHFNNAEEYQKYLVLLAESRGVLADETLSVSWSGSRSFTDLAPGIAP